MRRLNSTIPFSALQRSLARHQLLLQVNEPTRVRQRDCRQRQGMSHSNGLCTCALSSGVRVGLGSSQASWTRPAKLPMYQVAQGQRSTSRSESGRLAANRSRLQLRHLDVRIREEKELLRRLRHALHRIVSRFPFCNLILLVEKPQLATQQNASQGCTLFAASHRLSTAQCPPRHSQTLQLSRLEISLSARSTDSQFFPRLFASWHALA